jgi:hypothetical protein
MSRRFTIDEHLIPRIENEIRDLASDCKWIPGLVLTEDDFKCQLFLRLLRLPGADQSYQSEDGLWASPVHAEVPWFDENNRLTLRPDITITDPSCLRVLASPRGSPLPSKRFVFWGDAVVIELKYDRTLSGFSQLKVAMIRSDVKKIERLIAIARERGSQKKIDGIVAVLGRYQTRCDELQKLEDEVAAHQAIKLIVLPPITN